MRYVFLIGAVLALVARLTMFPDPSQIQAAAIFVVFFLCGGIFLAGQLLAD